MRDRPNLPGQPLPYVPFAPSAATQDTTDADRRAGRPYVALPLYLDSLRDEAAVAATIPVERSAGPVLKVVVEDDATSDTTQIGDVSHLFVTIDNRCQLVIEVHEDNVEIRFYPIKHGEMWDDPSDVFQVDR